MKVLDAQLLEVVSSVFIVIEEPVDLKAKVFVGLDDLDDVGGAAVRSDYQYSSVVVAPLA